MTQKLIPLYDRKRALTKSEFLEVVKELSNSTEIKEVFTDTQIIDNRKQYFNVVRIKEFREYPLVIGFVHEKYGRGVELSTYYPKKDSIDEIYSYGYMDVYIRGYSKELNRS